MGGKWLVRAARVRRRYLTAPAYTLPLQANATRAKTDALQFLDYQNMRGGKVGGLSCAQCWAGLVAGGCWLCCTRRETRLRLASTKPLSRSSPV